jgi:hypothetical protein
MCVFPGENLVMDCIRGLGSGSHLQAVVVTEVHNTLLRIQIDSTVTSLNCQVKEDSVFIQSLWSSRTLNFEFEYAQRNSRGLS